MKLLFDQNNKQQIACLLKFYWAGTWRAFVLSGAIILVPVITLLALGITPQAVTRFFQKFEGNIVYPCVLYLFGGCMNLYLIKYTSLRFYKTFKVDWTIPVPKSVFTKRFFYPVCLLTFLELGAYFASNYILSTLISLLLFHIFIVNNWLPLQLVPKNKLAN